MCSSDLLCVKKCDLSYIIFGIKSDKELAPYCKTGELMDRFPSLKLVDYGFLWKRDPVFPQDDITWFLLEK